ncbi:MAG: TolC family protein [Nitrospira sp.]|nr:TolC family protein [Nitrospira sp.]MBS0167541.1 TolC family protein [Nitrospira sp.]
MVHLLLRTLLLAGVVLPLLLIGTVVLAQDSRSYRLNEMIEMALEHNPALQEAATLIDQGKGLQATAAAYPNPSITGTVGPGRTREALRDIAFFERGVTVSQPVEWPGMRRARQRAAEAALAGSQAAVDATRLYLRAEVKIAFYQLLLAQRNAELIAEALAIAQDFLRGVKARVDAGQARPFEALKANVEVQKVSNDLNHAQHALVVGRSRLNAVTGGVLGKNFDVRGDFVSPPLELNLDGLAASAKIQHPTVRRVQKEIERAEHSVVQERQSLIPSVTISGLFQQEAAETAYLARLSVPIPLWYRRQGEITGALSAKKRAEAEQVRIQNELVAAITESVEEAHAAQDRIEVFEKGLLKQAEETLRIAKISFQQGAASLLEFIDAQRVHRQMLLEYTQARASFSVEVARLERWTGELR